MVANGAILSVRDLSVDIPEFEARGEALVERYLPA